MRKAEKFIQDYTRNCSNEILHSGKDSFTNIPQKGEYHPWLTPDQARRAVEIAREETTEEIKRLLKENYLIKSVEPLRWVSWEKVFNDLKQRKMILQANDFKVENDGIWISKKAIEEFRIQFSTLANEKGGLPKLDLSNTDMWYYLGKRDVLIDLLKHFEPLEP